MVNGYEVFDLYGGCRCCCGRRCCCGCQSDNLDELLDSGKVGEFGSGLIANVGIKRLSFLREC